MRAGRPRILLIAHGARHTGYGRVVKSLLPRLAGAYDIHHFSLDGAPQQLDWRWTTYARSLPADIHGRPQIAALARRLRPQLVWFVHDLYLLHLHAEALATLSPRPRIAVYFPVDGPVCRPGAFEVACRADCAVVFTRFARGEVERALRSISARPRPSRPEVAVIPHGVDVERFRPVGSSDATITAISVATGRETEVRAGTEDSFVVLNANRNALRKRVDLTLAAFADFSRGKHPHVSLLLQMGRRDLGVEVAGEAHRLGIADRVFMTTRSESRPEIPDTQLNMLYNAGDVGLNTATAEAWGLVAFEHAATEAAQVLPDHGPLRELWGDAALRVRAETTWPEAMDVVEHRLVSPRAVAARLETLYRDPVLRRKMAARARRRASAPELRWDAVAERWRGVLDRLIGA
jgi:glycosyltransferase involved in cell wall biosynthesis